MSINKFLLIAAIVTLVILFVFSSEGSMPVISCDFAPPNITVNCSGLPQEIVPDSLMVYEEMAAEMVEQPTGEQVQARRAEGAIQNLHALIPACQEDLTPALGPLDQEIRAWVAKGLDNRQAFIGSMIFEPYSVEQDRQMQRTRSDLFACYYNEMKPAENWMVISSAVRPYCRSSGCFEWTVSLLPFLFYLVTHPGPAALLWLVGFLLTGTALVTLSSILIKKRPALVPRTLIAFAAAELVLIVRPIWLWGLILGWILLCYSLALGYKSIKRDL